jgi:hypothetical protein
MAFFDVLPPADQKRGYTLRNYINGEINAGRKPRKEAVQALARLNDIARSKGGIPDVGPMMGSAKAPGKPGKPTPAASPDMIREAAEIAVAQEIAEANGLQPRPQDIIRLNEIMSAAQARLSPQQYDAAIKHFHEAKLKAHGEFEAMQKTQQRKAVEQAQQEEVSLRARTLAKALRTVSEKMSVPLETQEQLDAFRAGEKVKVSTSKARFPKAALAKQIKAKYGTSYEEHLKRLDDVAAAELSSPETAEQLREEYGFDKQTTKAWREGEGIRLGMAERMAEHDKEMPETEELIPSDEDERHMDLVTAAADHDEDPGDDLNLFKQNNMDLLREDSRHGDVARAFTSVEEFHESNQSE